jgi:hypothetical protein
MITKANYFNYVQQNSHVKSFPQFETFHEFTDEATQGGTDWSAYETEPETREFIDEFFRKLSAFVQKNTDTKPSAQPAKQSAATPPERKQAQQAAKSEKKAAVKRGSIKKEIPRKKAKTQAKKSTKVLNLPKGKLVELVDPHLLFVGRYLRMNNRVKSRNTIEKLFAQINQAADAKLLRKASPYASHIIYIQKQLLKLLDTGEQEFTIDIPAVKFNELIRSVAKEQQMTSVRLLKRYHNMAGKPVDIEKAKRFYNELYNAIEKGKIPERDRLFKRVTQVMKDLQQYVKNEDVQADLVRLPVELGGVLGFMDGCLCLNDRQINKTRKPDDVEIDF